MARSVINPRLGIFLEEKDNGDWEVRETNTHVLLTEPQMAWLADMYQRWNEPRPAQWHTNTGSGDDE